jgi:hypothetical protein
MVANVAAKGDPRKRTIGRARADEPGDSHQLAHAPAAAAAGRITPLRPPATRRARRLGMAAARARAAPARDRMMRGPWRDARAGGGARWSAMRARCDRAASSSAPFGGLVVIVRRFVANDPPPTDGCAAKAERPLPPVRGRGRSRRGHRLYSMRPPKHESPRPMTRPRALVRRRTVERCMMVKLASAGGASSRNGHAPRIGTRHRPSLASVARRTSHEIPERAAGHRVLPRCPAVRHVRRPRRPVQAPRDATVRARPPSA